MLTARVVKMIAEGTDRRTGKKAGGQIAAPPRLSRLQALIYKEPHIASELMRPQERPLVWTGGMPKRAQGLRQHFC